MFDPLLIVVDHIVIHQFRAKQKSWFLDYVPKTDNKNKPRTTKIKNITPVIYSECVLKVGELTDG